MLQCAKDVNSKIVFGEGFDLKCAFRRLFMMEVELVIRELRLNSAPHLLTGMENSLVTHPL
jgi:hypothetical protein